MKKITLLLAAFLTLATATQADAQAPLTFNWAHSIDGATSAGDNVMDMCKSSDGFYYIAATFGSVDEDLQFKTKVRNVNFDGEILKGGDNNPVEGSPYNDGTSYNRNLLLQKVAQNGDVSWNIYTKKGDVDQGSVLAATSDGGVVMVLKTRAWAKEAGYDNLLEIVDATGAVTTVKDMTTERSEYRFLVVRLTGEGKLVWTRLISGLVYHKSDGYGQNSTDNAYIKGVAVDNEGNIYLSGNYRTKLFLKAADGTTVTLTAKNNKDFGGDPQQSVGDLYLIKLDKDGYYVSSLTSESSCQAAYMDRIVYHDGKIYANGRVAGDGSEYLLGGKAINAATKHETPYIASINTSDLSVNYVTTLGWAEGNSKWGIHNKGIQYEDGCIWTTGGLQGTLASVPNKTGMYRGFAIRINPDNGEVLNTMMFNISGISECFGVYVNSSTVYAFGYNMTAGSVLVPYSKSNYAAGDAITLAKYSTTALACTPIIDDGNLIMMNRGGRSRSTTVEATFYGTDTKFSNLTAWGVVYYSYKIADTTTGISTATATATAGQYDVYTLDGALVKTAKTYDEAVRGLAAGVYVIGGKKVTID